MAVVAIDKKDLLAFVGKALDDGELARLVTDLGMPVEKITESEVQVDITPNRPDMFSAEGLGRAISSLAGIKTGLRNYSATDSGVSVSVERSVKKVRPYIAAAIARNVKMDDALVKSLVALQEKLHDTLGRRRRKVAIGFTDFNKLKPPFTYKAVKPDESPFIPLGQSEPWTPARILKELKQGQDYGYILEGHGQYPLICDSEGNVIALPPIITAEMVKITPSTRDVFIDVTGTSQHAVHECLKIICCALADRGAQIQSVNINYGKKTLTTPDLSPLKTMLPIRTVNKILGMDFTTEQIKEYLERMGHGVEIKEKGKLSVVSPTYRNDIFQEIDLAEDVAIAFGYNNFEPILPQFSSIGKRSPSDVRAGLIRDLMIGFGFTEVLAPYITNRATNFEKPMLGEHPAIHIKNPLTENFTMFRSWCIPSLLEILAASKDQKMPQKIFEVGHAAILVDGKPVEQEKLAAAICDPKTSFNEMRSIVEGVAYELGLKLEFAGLDSHPTFIPGRAVEIIMDGKPIGVFGEIHPQVLNNFGIEQPVTAFELKLA